MASFDKGVLESLHTIQTWVLTSILIFKDGVRFQLEQSSTLYSGFRVLRFHVVQHVQLGNEGLLNSTSSFLSVLPLIFGLGFRDRLGVEMLAYSSLTLSSATVATTSKRTNPKTACILPAPLSFKFALTGSFDLGFVARLFDLHAKSRPIVCRAFVACI